MCPRDAQYCRTLNGEPFCGPSKEGCLNGSHFYNGDCEPDTIENCCSHGNNCLNNDLYLVCADNEWHEDSTCSDNLSCNRTGTDCGTCINRKTECDNEGTTGKIYTCTAGEWPSEATRDCTNSRSCNSTGTACGTCINSTTTCSENSANIGTVRTCNNGRLEGSISCSTVSCNSDKTNCGECKNEDTKCFDGDDQIGLIKLCAKGVWTWSESYYNEKNPPVNPAENPPEHQILQSSCLNVSGKINDKNQSVCGECKNTESVTCKNDSEHVGQLTTCIDGIITTTACPNGASCDSTGTACGTCKNRIISCKKKDDVGQLSICDYGTETNFTICPGKTGCKNNTECNTCEDEEKFFVGSDSNCLNYDTLITGLSVGNIIYFGRYPQMNDVGDLRPIEWQVLKVKDNRILLITRNVIDAVPYHIQPTPAEGMTEAKILALYSMTWEESTMRSWLNGFNTKYNKFGINYTDDNFMKTAFTKVEKSHIITVENSTPKNSETNVSGGVDTDDSILILSLNEAITYFKTDTARQAIPTTYAKNAKNAITALGCTGDDCTALWYLRTPGADLLKTTYVYFNGVIDTNGFGVSEKVIGLRPAMWIMK